MFDAPMTRVFDENVSIAGAGNHYLASINADLCRNLNVT
jgi:hypothetical protein